MLSDKILEKVAFLWNRDKHLKHLQPVLQDNRLLYEGAPSWMADGGGDLTDYRNKLMQQDRRFNNVIANRFQDRGDGTWLDTLHNQVVGDKERTRAIGRLRMTSEREREKWWANLSKKMNSGKYVYDPLTKVQKFLTPTTNSPADKRYATFRNKLHKAYTKDEGETDGSFRFEGKDLTGIPKALSEEAIRRAYIQYLTK